jgi:hypothetical protein
MCSENDHFDVIFDPVAKTAIALIGQKFEFLGGPFKDYAAARQAARKFEATERRP